MSEEQNTYETIYEKLDRVFNALNKIQGGIKYINEIIMFVNNREEYFARFWSFGEVLEKWHIYLKIPYWENEKTKHYYMLVTEINTDEEITIKQIGEKIKEREREIISKVIDGLVNFLSDVVREDDC